MFLVYALLFMAFVYSGVVSYLAFRETGKKWMLFYPHWIGVASGVSRPLRRHGMAAFGLLFASTILYFYFSG